MVSERVKFESSKIDFSLMSGKSKQRTVDGV